MGNTKRLMLPKLIGFSILLGAASGTIVWVFLKLLAITTEYIWQVLPSKTESPVYTLIVCTVGGLIVGLFRKKSGDYPEEMMVVLGKVKNEKWYDYKKLPIILVAAFLPLIFATSVGPEAGLVGIITALCYWVADTLKKVANRGISADSQQPLSKATKNITYSLAVLTSLGCYVLLCEFLGSAMEGFPTFELALPQGKDMLFAVVYIVAGFILAKFYDLTHLASHKTAEKIPPILRETIAGFCLGLAATFVPQIMFSGEGEIHHLMTDYVDYLPWALLGIAFLKVLITNICIQFGMKGGHFFPLIYAGVALGYALAMLFFPESGAEHVIFAAAIVTSALLGANMKQPLIVSLVLLICFPFRMIFWIVIAAAAGSALASIGKPKEV